MYTLRSHCTIFKPNRQICQMCSVRQLIVGFGLCDILNNQWQVSVSGIIRTRLIILDITKKTYQIFQFSIKFVVVFVVVVVCFLLFYCCFDVFVVLFFRFVFFVVVLFILIQSSGKEN